MSSVLVTGGAGFIGSHTCKRLAQEGFQPIIFDNLTTGFEWSAKWGPLVKGDLHDLPLLEKLCTKYAPLAVMHFAALTDARKGQKEPERYHQNNVAGTLNLIEVVKKFQIPHFIFSSSCAVYGNPEYVSIDEKHPKHPINVYGETKWLGEKMVKSLGIPSAILRYFNAAGADPEGDLGESHDPATHLIPILIDTALKKRDNFTIFGKDHPTKDGTPIRDYIHVSDLAEAHVLALKKLMNDKQDLTLNLGTGKGFSVQEIIHSIIAQFQCELPVRLGKRDPSDPPCLVANSDLAHKTLNWKPRYSSLSTILETTWKWQSR